MSKTQEIWFKIDKELKVYSQSETEGFEKSQNPEFILWIKKSGPHGWVATDSIYDDPIYHYQLLDNKQEPIASFEIKNKWQFCGISTITKFKESNYSQLHIKDPEGTEFTLKLWSDTALALTEKLHFIRDKLSDFKNWDDYFLSERNEKQSIISNKIEKLTLGGIYRGIWIQQALRIIGMDELEIFYDCQLSDDFSWMFSGNFKKKCYFYRIPKTFFAENSTRLSLLPLSQEENHYFRPELPLRICRNKSLSWNQIPSEDYKSFAEYLTTNFDEDFNNQRLCTDSIILIPFGPKGSLKKGEKISADNNKYFTAAELIWKAKTIQEAANPNSDQGIGIYRIGFEKGIPTYYIGEYFDKAGFIKE